jgi:type II secretory pathway pseudopilin PulG
MPLSTKHRRARLVGGGPTPPAPSVETATAGFTLVEVLIAVMFLSVGILSVAQVFSLAQRHASRAREESVAVFLAQEIREKIMSETYSDVASMFNGVDTNVPSTVPQPADEWAGHVHDRLGDVGRGRIRVRTEADDPNLGHGLLDVLITMSWREGSRTVSFPLRFLIAKTGA